MTGDFSVLMSVYCQDDPVYLAKALSSIYPEQTLRPNEVILIADGDLTKVLYNVIEDFKKQFSECNVILHNLKQNVGLAKALNIGIGLCHYDLIVRMDADDISLPTRFSKQLEFMNAHPEISVCGTFVEEVEPQTLKSMSIRKVPLCHDEIKTFAKKRSPVSHPSVIFRKHVVLEFGGYPDFRKSQDYALWSNLLKNNVNFANIPDILLKMRAGSDLQQRRGLQYFKYEHAVLKYQLHIGFLSRKEYIINLLLRFIVRSMPIRVREKIYMMRNSNA